MAKFTVTSLNYMSSGGRRSLLNLDMSVDYSYVDKTAFVTEDKHSGFVDESEISGLTKDEIKRSFPELDLTYRNKTFIIDKDLYKTTGADKNILSSSEVVIYPVYDIKDVCVKSPMKKVFRKNFVLPETDSFVDIYHPDIDADPIAFCNYDDRSIVLTQQTDKDFVYVKTSFRKTRAKASEFYYTTYCDNDQRTDTYTYTPVGELTPSVSSYQQYLSTFAGDFTDSAVYDRYVSAVYDIFTPKYNHRGVDYNYILNLEQTEIGLTYDSGNVYGLAAKAKNALNQLYSQDMDSTGSLLNFRNYSGVIENSNAVYLKFTNNVNYSVSHEVSSDNFIVVNHTKVTDTASVPYQKIEQFTPTKIGSTTRHKSNLFSVKIKNTNLENASTEQAVNIRKDISNAVYDIVSQICPVNTQLFNVQFID